MHRLLTVMTCLSAVGAVTYVYGPPISEIAGMSRWGLGVVIGTLLLAVIAGELCRFAKLPRVLGYAVMGLVAVPLTTGIFGVGGLDSVAYFHDQEAPFAAAALLTGLSIGLAFSFERLAQHLRAVFAHILGHIVVGGGVMFVAFWGIHGAFAPLSLVTVTPLIVAALMTVTSSPTAIYAVNADMHAEGRFPELQINVAVIKNLLIGATTVVLIVALDVGFDAAAFDPVAFVNAHWINLSVALGGGLAFGLLLLGVLRTASNQVVVVTLTVAAIVAIVWPHSAIALFGVGTIGGVVARNGSQHGFNLSDSLDRSSPFFISVAIVFAIVQTPLPHVGEPWAIAAGLVVLRTLGVVVGSRLAGALTSNSETTHFSYSILAQSLVALFFVQTLANAGPSFEFIALLVPPIVVLNLIAGSFLHRMALVRSGVAIEIQAVEDARFVVHQRSPARGAEGSKLDDERSLLPPPNLEDPAFRSESLNRIAIRLRQRAHRAQDNLARTFFDPRRDYVEHVVAEARARLQAHVLETFQELREVSSASQRRSAIRGRRSALDAELLELILTLGPSHEPGRLHETLVEFVHEMERACQVEIHVRAPEEDATREPDPNDGAIIKARKAFHAMNTRFGPRPVRIVPVRALALHHLGTGLPRHLEPAVHLDGRFRVFLWQRLTNAYLRIDEMYLRTLVHLDDDKGTDPELGGPSTITIDVDAIARESEELAAFDQRLNELSPAAAGLEVETISEVEPLLADAEAVVADDPVLSAWAQFVDEFPTDFDDLENDVATFEADVRRRLVLALDPAYRAFLHDLRRAGTYALPARQIEAESDVDALDALGLEISHWRTLARAFVDRRAMLLGFRDLESNLRTLLDSFVTQVETELCSHLTYYPAEISERCDDVVAALRDTFAVDASDADLTDAFVQIRHSLADFLQEEALASVHLMRETNLFGELLRKFTDRISDLVREQRESFSLVNEEYLDASEMVSARGFEPSPVAFQEVLDRHFVQTTIASFNELSMRVQNVVDTVASGLGEVNRVVSFNLDAALNELRTDDGEVANRTLVTEFALGGIRRAGDQAADLLEVVQAEIDGIDADILNRTVEHLRAVRRYLFDESMGRLERLAFEVEKDRSQLQQQGSDFLRGLGGTALHGLLRAAQPARVAADLARQRLQLDEAGRDELVEDVGIATFDAEQLRLLPLAYRRLFTPTPVEIPELFVTRAHGRQRFEAAIARWHAGRRVSIVISGDLGAGKTSFLHRALADQLTAAKLVRWNVRERITSEAALAAALSKQFGVRRSSTISRLLGAIRDDETRRVVVVDGIERLFLRTMAGRDALQSFLSLVSQSPPELMWLVTCNTTLWAYLETMLSAEDFFTDHIAIDNLGRADTEALIVQRHRVSGYSLEFEPDTAEQITPSRFTGNQQDRLRRRYFDRLYEATDGHPLLALYYWLASLTPAEQSDELRVAPLRALRVDHLRRLGDDKLIALGQILLHEEISEEGFAAVMRTNTEVARRDLAYFESLNLVVREPGRRFQYRINEVLYHDVERALHHRNIV